jgi:hypothetical protein
LRPHPVPGQRKARTRRGRLQRQVNRGLNPGMLQVIDIAVRPIYIFNVVLMGEVSNDVVIHYARYNSVSHQYFLFTINSWKNRAF